MAAYRPANGSSPSAWFKGRQPSGAVLHSLRESGELTQWLDLSHDVTIINIVLVFIIIIIIIKSTKSSTAIYSKLRVVELVGLQQLYSILLRLLTYFTSASAAQ